MKDANNDSQLFLETKASLDDIKQRLIKSLGVSKGNLIKCSKGIRYRVRFSSVNEVTGEAEVYVSEIKNNEVNWTSCSLPRLKAGEFEVLNWSFDSERLDALHDALEQSDSISESNEIKRSIKELFESCFHNWEAYGDIYTCTECRANTVLEKTRDWLNGEKEIQNIDLSEWE